LPKLSIITVNYNNAFGLQKTINSVINQTFSDFEFIVIDGGSSDYSSDLLTKYAGQINYGVSEPDNGIYHAMNKGIVRATGEYCFFLNSGDYFVNERVLENVFMYNYHEDVQYGNLLVFLNRKFVGKSKGKAKLTFLDIYSSIIKHQASFIKRKLFEEYGLYNENFRIISDWEFFLKTLGLGRASYQYIDLDITCFDNNGISNSSHKLVYEERISVIKKHIPLMMQEDYENMLKYGQYLIVARYNITRFVLRIMLKGINVLNQAGYKQ
jgi:glycosyltransferase involved in cell wall biosynthesis